MTDEEYKKLSLQEVFRMGFYFKKGVCRLNGKSNFDFRLNRAVMWDGRGMLSPITG